MHPSTPPPPPPDPPYVEVADYIGSHPTPQDLVDLASVNRPLEAPPREALGLDQHNIEAWEAYEQRNLERDVDRQRALVRLVQRHGAKNLQQLLEALERELKITEDLSFKYVAFIRDAQDRERQLRKDATKYANLSSDIAAQFQAILDRTTQQVERFTRYLHSLYWLLNERRNAIKALREVQTSVSMLDRLAAGDFNEPDSIMLHLQSDVQNGLGVVIRQLEFLARSRSHESLIRALAIEILAGARVYEIDSVVLDAILDAIHDKDADLQFAAIAAASDLSSENQGRLIEYIKSIASSTSDPDVRRAARAFVELRT